MQKFAVSSLVLLLSAACTPAVILKFLTDDCDDHAIVEGVYEQVEVMQFRQKLDDFKKKLYPLKERDFVALFGKSQPKPATAYAMPVAQSRGLALSGMRHREPKLNKDHTEFYIVKDVAGLEVYYQIDGETPAAILFYFPADKDFPKLTRDNLAKRLSWEEDHWQKFVAYYEKRIVEVFPWKIDRNELAKLHQGDFAVDAQSKLEAWIESGKSLGYKYGHEESSNEWYWYRANGKLARTASRGARDGPPVEFVWHHEDGSGELRMETFSYPSGQLSWRRWQQPKNTFNIRFESPRAWCWYDKDGKPVRQEWDDNGDSIPDWYITNEDEIVHVFDRAAMEKRKPLKIEDSWAINPKLIPEESRIPDQFDLRVPIRRKTIDKPAKK